tara:strand:- start:1766 stop:2107 length:342 start_codon:yes stop_codon:yes gene_type:complete
LPKLALSDQIESGELNTLLREALQANPGLQQTLLSVQIYEAAHKTLAAQFMNAWPGLIAQQQSIAIQEKRIVALASNEKFIVQRYRNGTGSLDDLTSARSVLADVFAADSAAY